MGKIQRFPGRGHQAPLHSVTPNGTPNAPAAPPLANEAPSPIAEINDLAARAERLLARRPLPERKIWTLRPGIEPAYQCQRCKDTGYVRAYADDGDRGWGTVRIKVSVCACQESTVRMQRAKRTASASNLTPEMDCMTFATYDRRQDERAYDAALAFAAGGVGAAPFLFLTGKYGSGKTHLLAAIAHDTLARGRAPLFAVVPKLLDWFRAGFDPNDRAEKLAFQVRFDGICDADILLMDDLGAEKTTDWTQERLFTLINHRYARRLPTVFSSNCMPDELEGRIQSRVMDRAVSQVVYVTAGDYRRSAARKKGA
jgi:DNA replication protein DnaC